MPTTTTTITQAQNTQAYLEALYLLDGRDNPSHPMHGLFTGLFINRQAALLAGDQELLAGLHSTDDDDETPLFHLLNTYIGHGFIADDAAAAVSAAWCRIVAARLVLAVKRLDVPSEGPASRTAASVQAVADWLNHEAVRAELNTPAADAAPSSVEPVTA